MTAGQRAPALDLAGLERLEPEVVVVKPCGYPLQRTLAELELLPRVLPWASWPAVRAGRVFVADGNAYFNRSGPRIVDSAELLAACLHPRGSPATWPATGRRSGGSTPTSRSSPGSRNVLWPRPVRSVSGPDQTSVVFATAGARPLSRSWLARSARARATRERMVPTGSRRPRRSPHRTGPAAG